MKEMAFCGKAIYLGIVPLIAVVAIFVCTLPVFRISCRGYTGRVNINH